MYKCLQNIFLFCGNSWWRGTSWFNNCVVRKVGNGQNTSFWRDTWVRNQLPSLDFFLFLFKRKRRWVICEVQMKILMLGLYCGEDRFSCGNWICLTIWRMWSWSGVFWFGRISGGGKWTKSGFSRLSRHIYICCLNNH